MLQPDLVVLGAGPVGLFAACYAGMRGLSTVVVDSLPEVGGQVSALYPEKLIHDVAGLPAVRGRDLVDQLVAQAARFDPTYLLGTTVQDLRVAGDRVHLTASGEVEISAGAVVICAGIGRFTPKALGVGEEWLGRGLSYFVPQLSVHRDRDVVVVGGGDSACDWALALEPLARSVTLVHRRAAFRAHAHSVAQLHASSVELVTDAEVSAIEGGDWIERITLRRGKNLPETRPAGSVVAALGFSANVGPLRGWGLDVADNRFVRVGTTMATNLPRVYAAGDINDYPGKVRLIAVGFGEAATAVNNAALAIDPAASLFPGHSTDASPLPL